MCENLVTAQRMFDVGGGVLVVFFTLRFVRIKVVFYQAPAPLYHLLLPSRATNEISFFLAGQKSFVSVSASGLFAASAVFYSSLLLLLLLALVQIICWRTGERVEGHCTHLLFYFLFISFQFCVYFSLFRFVFILIFFFWCLLLICTIFMRWTFLNWQRR